jgi:hypothetical protein
MENKKNQEEDESKKKKKKKKKKRKSIKSSDVGDLAQDAAIGAGIGLAAIEIDDFGKHRQYEKYSCSQGQGYAAEDIAQDNHPDWKKEPCMHKKNEPDFTAADGTPIQVKACKNAGKTASNLFDHGEFRYPDTTIAVPDGQEAGVKARLEKKGIEADVVGIGADYDTIRNNNTRGFDSACYDAKQALKNPIPHAIGWGVAIAVYAKTLKRLNKKALKSGKAPNTKKIKIISGLGAAGAYTGTVALYVWGCVLKGWSKRPKVK